MQRSCLGISSSTPLKVQWRCMHGHAKEEQGSPGNTPRCTRGDRHEDGTTNTPRRMERQMEPRDDLVQGKGTCIGVQGTVCPDPWPTSQRDLR